jgi:hypothetical protein
MAGHGPQLPPEDPAVERELAERGRALIAAAVAETSAPLALRERIERDRERARPAARRRWFGVAGSIAAVGAAVLAAIVIEVGGTQAPGVLATVQLAGKGPALPAPKHDPANPALLQAKSDGLPFPNWYDKFQWRASGARTDTIGDRDAKTVYYDSPLGARLAYTILGGKAIAPPDGARTIRRHGTEFHVMNRGGRRIVVWERAGHTCVMSAPVSVPQSRLIDLAGWDAGGIVPF